MYGMTSDHLCHSFKTSVTGSCSPVIRIKHGQQSVQLRCLLCFDANLTQSNTKRDHGWRNEPASPKQSVRSDDAATCHSTINRIRGEIAAAAAIVFEGHWTHSQCEGNQLMRWGNRGPAKHVTFIKACSGMMFDGDTEDHLPRLRKDAIPHYQTLARRWPALLSSSLVALRGHLRVPKSQQQCAEQMHCFHFSILLLRR